MGIKWFDYGIEKLNVTAAIGGEEVCPNNKENGTMGKYFKVSDGIYYIPQLKCICKTEDNMNELDIASVSNILCEHNNEDIYQQHFNDSKSFPGYVPLHIDIFPTYECNLRCRYCYSGTGDYVPRVLTKEQIDRMIKELSKTARMKKMVQKSDERVYTEIFLAGGGEPTFDWELFSYIVEKAKQASESFDYSVRFGIVTNGFIQDGKHIDYICNNFSYVQVSVDGAEKEQNIHRPTASGENSSEIVYSFINRCIDNGILIGLRMTVSSETVNTMDTSVEFFAHQFPGISHIQIEPLSMNTKSNRNSLSAPDPAIFADKYIRSWHLLKGTGIGLFSSVSNIFSSRPSDHFCDAVVGGTIILNPDGFLSTCYEASTDVEEMSHGFFIGKIEANGDLTWFNNSEHVFGHGISYGNSCRECICWSFCKGGCVASMLRNQKNRAYHCSISKNITKQLVREIAENQNDNLDIILHILEKPSSDLNKLVYWVDQENGTKLVLANLKR